MSSMRYVRGGNNSQEGRGRGGSQFAGSGGRWSHAGRAGGRGRGRGGGRGAVAGRFSSSRGRFNNSFVRGASAGPTVGHKWVRDSVEDEKNDELEDTKITSDDATSHHELLQSENAIIVSQASALSDEAKPAATSEQASSSLERRGNHKLVMKKDKSDIVSDGAPQTEKGNDKQYTMHVSSSSKPSIKSNVWKRQTPDASNDDGKGAYVATDNPIEEYGAITNTSEVSPAINNTEAKNSEKSSGEKEQSIQISSKNKSHAWKRPSPEMPKSKEENDDDTHKSTVERNEVIPRDKSEQRSGEAVAQIESKHSSIGNMERKGFSKLELKRHGKEHTETSDNNTKVKAGNNSWKRQTPTHQPTERQNLRQQKPKYAGSHAKRKRPDHAPGARRIQLVKPLASETPKEPSEADQAEGAQEDVHGAEKEIITQSDEQKPAEKTLTDFCYQDTGRGIGAGRTRGRGRGRGHPAGRGGRVKAGGNMGLVRVKPTNPSSTPICPTFRRGLPCNNPKCTLRHDVSTEASRPICVFFQRMGMCSKDDCPFRHVKVRWDAEICPAFQRAGYCEDPDCTLRHVVAKKKPRIEQLGAKRPSSK